MAVPPRPISPRIQYSGSSAASAVGVRSLLIAGCRTGKGAASASGPGSVCVETKHDLAQLDAVAVGELTLTVEVRQLLVIHYYRVGGRKIRDRPLSARVGQPGMLPAYRARVECNVLRGPARISTEDHLWLLTSDSDESDLLVSRVSREHLQMARQQLDDLVGWPDEPDRLARGGSLTIVVHGGRDIDGALPHAPPGRRRRWWWRRCKADRRLDGSLRRSRKCRLPFDSRVHREDERNRGIRGALAVAPPLVVDGSRGSRCEKQNGDDDDHDGDGMRVILIG